MKEKRLSKFAEPEISFAGEVPLPPNVRPVIVVQGSDYDMGYQYYQQLVQIFGRWVATHPRREYLPSGGSWYIGPWFIKEIKRNAFTDDQLTIIKKWEAQFIKYTPEMIDMYKGMADGATDAGIPLSYVDVLAHFTGYLGSSPGSEREMPSTAGCSGFAAWGSTTKDGKLICASNGDDNANYFSTTIVAFPEKGNNFIYSPFNVVAFGCFPCHPGMNNKGLAYVHHGGGTGVGNEKMSYGIPRGVAALHTLRFANNASEALDMQLAYPRGIKAGGLWADVDGNAVCIECRYPKVIRRPGYIDENDFIFAANNCLCKELGCEGEVYVPYAGWLGTTSFNISSIPRNLEMWNMLHLYQGEVELEFAKMMYRFPGKPPNYPTMEEAGAAYHETKGKGWDQKIGNLMNAVIGIIIPDAGDEGLYYVCTGRAARVAYPLRPLPDGFSCSIAPTYSFYQLRLASSPERVVTSARAQAQYDLYYTNVELRKLNYTNEGYAALDEIFNQAVTEWFRGEYYLSLAVSGMTIGNENIYNHAKALRAFTRCQALAKQVYNSLVPPATCPEDIGLKPF